MPEQNTFIYYESSTKQEVLPPRRPSLGSESACAATFINYFLYIFLPLIYWAKAFVMCLNVSLRHEEKYKKSIYALNCLTKYDIRCWRAISVILRLQLETWRNASDVAPKQSIHNGQNSWSGKDFYYWLIIEKEVKLLFIYVLINSKNPCPISWFCTYEFRYPPQILSLQIYP